ncbi:DUF2637 domain-containing protein [Streptomyces sp. HUAS MG47]|uniref:DUF2637 domain-containing protein n=1 Tax=Streptomyces solicamelliae TaxID=3231716 RepID=UPI0038779855
MDWYSNRPSYYIPPHPMRPGPETLDPYGTPIPAQQTWDDRGVRESTLTHQNFEEELAQMLAATATVPPAPAVTPTAAPPVAESFPPPYSSNEPPPSRIDRRRSRPKPHVERFLKVYQRVTQVSLLFAVIALCAACLLAWSVSYTYGQLRITSESVLPGHLAQWWPLTVYGPWFVAALSILRATVQHQPASRSWGVLLVTSGMAVALCVSHSSHSVLAYVTLGIPPITSLVCFWELVGQFSSKRQGRRGAHSGPQPSGAGRQPGR